MRIIEQTQPPKTQAARQTSLHLSVIFTGQSATRAALRKAAQLAGGLDALVRVIVLKAVPYPLPIDTPPVAMRFDRERMLAFVSENSDDASVLMCYCRDEVDALLYLLQINLHLFRSKSIVVIGGKKRRWLPTKEQLIARKLEEAGHRVVFVDSGGNHA